MCCVNTQKKSLQAFTNNDIDHFESLDWQYTVLSGNLYSYARVALMFIFEVIIRSNTNY